ncbi:eukaryotic translation initiation factor 4 gamma 3-like [Platichthys flesus]|uniref:eukaryotic translation initiation factor 4 gamma 3-like n=1 Tax=Platichthys flesus TaxID=8260 RepID=UPI002DB733AD|nr:eukaryotic translation initiation factor 4 gamma 3-like [Platichthys flesus]
MKPRASMPFPSPQAAKQLSSSQTPKPRPQPQQQSQKPQPQKPLIKGASRTKPGPDLADPSGKRTYDRAFLLSLQLMPACIQKPEGLPPISDVVLEKMSAFKFPSRDVDSPKISRGPDFTTAFADFGRQMVVGQGAQPVTLGVRRPPPRKIIMSLSLHDDVQLRKSENAWKPGMKRESLPAEPESNKTQDLFKKVRSILNKLTPEKFNQLMKQVTDLTIDTEERLKGVIDLVFEKAIDEPSFSVAYGSMCRCLATLKVPSTDKPNTTLNFQTLLLRRCQKEFEKGKEDDVVFERKQKELDSAASTERDRLQVELQEAKDIARRRSIGNIKFIGELFKLKMLNENIMHDCVVKLLVNNDEDSLECLCRLFTTIGKDFDLAKAKPRMDHYFNYMEKIVREGKTSSRTRFMLQDIIDLRLHNWVSRRADQGPKTIDQIHKEAKIEEQEEQRKVQQALLSKDNKRRPDPREQREQRDQRVQREETWNTVPMTKNSRTIDPNKIPKISKPQMDETTQLGPRAQVTWVKGSGGGAKANDSELSRTAGLNRFSALQLDPSPQPSTTPPQNPDFNAGTTRGSRSHTEKERSNKPLTSAPNVTKVESEPERSRVREPVKPEPVQTMEKPARSEEEIERKSKSIIDEFLHIKDFKEAVQCVVELDLGSHSHIFIRVGVESTLERSQITRDHLGQLLFQLAQKGILPKPQFYKGFADTLEQADDMAIDVPHIWLYLAELLSPVLKEGGFSMRELFSELSKPLLPVGRAGILISEILLILCKQMGHRTVASLWEESGLNWTDLLPEEEDVQAFISQQKLHFLQPQSPSVSEDGSEPESSSVREPDDGPNLQTSPPEAAISNERPSAKEPATSHSPGTLAAMSGAASTALNSLTKSETELETAAIEPSLMPPAALQPQLSSPAYREAAPETLPADTTPQQSPDPGTTLGSRTGRKRRRHRKRGAKPQSSASSPDLITRASSSKELLESPTQEEPPRDSEPEGAEPQRPNVSEEESETLPSDTTPQQIPDFNVKCVKKLHFLQPQSPSVSEDGSEPESSSVREPDDGPNLQTNPPEAAISNEHPSAKEPATSHSPGTLAAMSGAASTALNSLTMSETELETAAIEPSLMPPAALQPQASSPAYREAASETLPADTTPQQSPDPGTTLGSRTGRKRRRHRKRSAKPQSSASSPDLITRASSSKELLESPTPEEPPRDSEPEGAEPQRPNVSEEESETLPSDTTPQQIPDFNVKCVKENMDGSHLSSSPYLRALMTAVCEAAVKNNTKCRVHTALIQKRIPVLIKYRNSESERQLQALRALQSLIVALDHPTNLLQIFFECTYDEDAFCKSGTRKDPANQLGKGVALKSVTDFFTWLREAEEAEDY